MQHMHVLASLPRPSARVHACTHRECMCVCGDWRHLRLILCSAAEYELQKVETELSKSSKQATGDIAALKETVRTQGYP